MYGRGHLINHSDSNPGSPINLNSNPTPDSCSIFKSGHWTIRIIFGTSRRGTEFAVSNLPPPPGGSVATERKAWLARRVAVAAHTAPRPTTTTPSAPRTQSPIAPRRESQQQTITNPSYAFSASATIPTARPAAANPAVPLSTIATTKFPPTNTFDHCIQ